MNVNWELHGDAELSITLEAHAQNFERLEPILLQAGIIVRDEAVRRIQVGGDPAWPPPKAEQDHALGIDTGTMWRSLMVDMAAPGEVVVGVSGPASSYAGYFQNGTGVFVGHSPWTITPTTASVLSWVAGGTRYFARSVTIEGSPPRPFLYFDLALADRVMAFIRRALLLGGPANAV